MSVIMELSTVINRPIEEVFKNATCLKGCINWQTATVSTEKVGSEPTKVGTRYNHVVKFMGNANRSSPRSHHL